MGTLQPPLTRGNKADTYFHLNMHGTLLPYHPYTLTRRYLCSGATILTPWSRVLLEKPTGSQLVKKFPAFYGTRKLITAFSSARRPFLS